jgi:1,4-dihydroxy-2-naphthoyl-CoA synthase
MRRQSARRLRRIRSSIRAVARQQDIEESGLKWMAEFSKRSPKLFEILKNVTSFRAPTETFEREKTLDLAGVRIRSIWLATQRQA